MSIVCFKYYERKKSLRLSKEEKFYSIKKPANFDPDNMAPIFIIPEKDLTVIDELGSGAFGKVFLGYWKTKDPSENRDIKCKKINIFKKYHKN